MANHKKKLNWTEIEARYISGEPPRVIAEDYQKCTAKQIGIKASKSGWVIKKNKMAKKHVKSILDSQQEEIDRFCENTLSVCSQFMEKLASKEMMDMINNPYLFDGERTNSLFQTAMKESVRVYLTLAHEARQSAAGDDDGQDAIALEEMNGQSDDMPA